MRKPRQEEPVVATYRHCCLLLLACQYSYYALAVELLTDAEYDRFNDRLAAFERENPSLKHPKSPTYSLGSERADSYPPSVVVWAEGAAKSGHHAVDRDGWAALFSSLPVKDSTWQAQG